jgi:GNAT superfamily N-acetyltransferase
VIREFEWSDLEGAVALLRDVYPAFVSSPESFAHRMRSEPQRARRRWWVADEGGRIVGWATSGMHIGTPRGDVSWLGVSVHPGSRRRGVGGELFAIAEAHATALGARKLLTDSRDDPHSVRFAECRGFRNTHTQNVSAVDPTTIDFAELPTLRAAAEATGLRLAPFTKLGDRVEAIYAADMETTQDIPMDEPMAHIPFDEWRTAHWENPLRSPETSWAVLDGERVVSFTMLRVDPASGRALTDMTGTLREYRGRGLARLVKLASLETAVKLGVTRVITENDRTNAPMLALNQRLGFRPYAALLSWTRE